MSSVRYVIDFKLAGRWYQPEGDVPTTHGAAVAELFDLAQSGGFDDAAAVRVTRIDGRDGSGSWQEVTDDFLLDVASMWCEAADDYLAGAPSWLVDEPSVQDWIELRQIEDRQYAEDVELERLAYRRAVL